jgi:hypothetical protein
MRMILLAPPLRRLAAGCACLCLATLAQAAPVLWAFEYAGTGISALGTLQTEDTPAGGPYLVIALDGQRNGAAMALIAPGDFSSNSNLLADAAPFLDFGGLSFGVAGDSFNLYVSDGVIHECSTLLVQACDGSVASDPVVSFSAHRVLEVPEPASPALTLVGLLALAGTTRRRQRRPAP